MSRVPDVCTNGNTNAIQLQYTPEDYEILVDRTETGKERDWSGKKKRALSMSKHFAAASLDSKSERLSSCADTLLFKQDNARLRLYQSWFCKVRLCPMCNWRRSLKIAWQNKQIIEEANRQEKLRWLFLTLTVRNVEGDELKDELTRMTQAFNRLFKYKRVNQAVIGYFRAMEVTKNTDKDSASYGTYHPHFHVLLCVRPSYFKGGKYISQADWTAMWQKAGKLDYEPIVHITAVKPKKKPVDAQEVAESVRDAVAESQAVFEVSKYPVKDTDIIGASGAVTDETVETVLTLDNALAYKRLIGYGGLLKQIRMELQLDDAEEGDLVHVEGEQDETADAAFEVMAYWHIGLRQYVVKRSD